jgi:hypothetical protein
MLPEGWVRTGEVRVAAQMPRVTLSPARSTWDAARRSQPPSPTALASSLDESSSLISVARAESLMASQCSSHRRESRPALEERRTGTSQETKLAQRAAGGSLGRRTGVVMARKLDLMKELQPLYRPSCPGASPRGGPCAFLMVDGVAIPTPP